ncbi:hypothetical protein GW17_00028042 [Ensete ventricosum]|nr:hypothetical protein GW17_00028042 [Ensete ventricosum]
MHGHTASDIPALAADQPFDNILHRAIACLSEQWLFCCFLPQRGTHWCCLQRFPKDLRFGSVVVFTSPFPVIPLIESFSMEFLMFYQSVKVIMEAAQKVGEELIKTCKDLNIFEISSYDLNGFARGERMAAFEIPISQHGFLLR